MTEFVHFYQEILQNYLHLLLLGERRIRVHTLCLPVVSSLADVYAGADVQAVVCLLANMGECRPGRFKFQISFSVLTFDGCLNEVVNEA